MSTLIDSIVLKIVSPLDGMKYLFNKIFFGKQIANKKKYFSLIANIERKYFKNGIWDFSGVKLPDYTSYPRGINMYPIYMDTLFVYCEHQDNYSSKLIDKLDNLLPEGAYGYKSDIINVTVKENDVVIDAGAWIGDFSAYASKKGAFVYAFEPNEDIVNNYLKITQQLNTNITIIKRGLGSKHEYLSFFEDPVVSEASKIVDKAVNICDNNAVNKIEITSVDDFVNENNIKRIDFIKSDIEGFERELLIGAKETLRKFAPKLAICTYHLPDDPEVLSKLILDANPNYIVVQKRKKLYAMVPK